MISISTNAIPVNLSYDEFKNIFSDLNKIGDLFKYKNVKYLNVSAAKISFLLQRVANFELQFSKENNESWVQLESTKNNHFKSAFRFEYQDEEQAMTLHLETDTNVFMELFLERRLKKLVTGIANNIKAI